MTLMVVKLEPCSTIRQSLFNKSIKIKLICSKHIKNEHLKAGFHQRTKNNNKISTLYTCYVLKIMLWLETTISLNF